MQHIRAICSYQGLWHIPYAYQPDMYSVQMIEHGASIDMPDGRGQTPIHLAARNDHEKLVQLLVQHSVRMTRDSLGLSPRDYAMRPRTHDLLKVEELRQGFELRFDACLTFILPRGSQEERDFFAAGHSLGPPDPDLVSAEHVSDLIYTGNVKKRRMEGAVTRLQRTVRGRQWRALMHLLKARNRGPCRKFWDLLVAILLLPFTLILWLFRFTRRLMKLLCRISFDCCCAPLLRRQRQISSRLTSSRVFPRDWVVATPRSARCSIPTPRSLLFSRAYAWHASTTCSHGYQATQTTRVSLSA